MPPWPPWPPWQPQHQHQHQRRLRTCIALADKAMRLVLPDDQAGGRPGSRVTSLASPREVTKRRRPRRWRSATRTPRAASTGNGKRPKLASLRQRTLLYPISALATCRRLTGFHCNGNGNDNCSGNGNGNCRYAEPQPWPRGTPPQTILPLPPRIPLPCNTLPNRIFFLLGHEHPVRHLSHRPAAPPTNIIEQGRADSDAGCIRTGFRGLLHRGNRAAGKLLLYRRRKAAAGR